MTSHHDNQAPGVGRDSPAQADFRPVPVSAAPRGPVRKSARRRRFVWASIAVLTFAGLAGLVRVSGVEPPSELQSLVRPLRMVASGSEADAKTGAALPLDLHAWKDRVENGQRESTARIDALTAQVDALRQDLDRSRADLAARLDQFAVKLDRLEQSGLRTVARREPEPQSAAPAVPKPKRVAAQPKPPANRTVDAPQQSAATEPAMPREATANAVSQRRAEAARTASSEGNIFQRAGRWIVSTGRSIVSSD